MVKEKRRKTIVWLGIAIMMIGIVTLMPGCSSKRIPKNQSRVIESYEEMLDYLKISKRERVLVDSITKLDEFIVFTDVSRQYFKKKKAMNKEDAEKTKEFDDYVKACSAVFRILDKVKLSANASVAVFEKAHRTIK